MNFYIKIFLQIFIKKTNKKNNKQNILPYNLKLKKYEIKKIK